MMRFEWIKFTSYTCTPITEYVSVLIPAVFTDTTNGKMKKKITLKLEALHCVF